MYPQQEIDTLRRSTAAEMAGELLTPAGLRIIDIGCGEGDLTRALALLGAELSGIDPHEGRIERARAAAAEAGVKIAFEVAAGEDLPYADGAFDVALLSNSLHHVAEDRMAATINEAARMVRPGGLLDAMEPVPRGPYFEVQSLWNDETANRARAYDEIGAAAKLGFENEAERFYIEARAVDDFDTYVARAGARHESLRAEIERQSDRIRQKFEQHAVRADGGFALDMVFRVNLMRKSA